MYGLPDSWAVGGTERVVKAVKAGSRKQNLGDTEHLLGWWEMWQIFFGKDRKKYFEEPAAQQEPFTPREEKGQKVRFTVVDD